MPKRDVMGETVQRVAKTLGTLRTSMRENMPTGPRRAQLTPKEARLQIQNLDPATKAALIAKVGDEEWERMLSKLYA